MFHNISNFPCTISATEIQHKWKTQLWKRQKMFTFSGELLCLTKGCCQQAQISENGKWTAVHFSPCLWASTLKKPEVVKQRVRRWYRGDSTYCFRFCLRHPTPNKSLKTNQAKTQFGQAPLLILKESDERLLFSFLSSSFQKREFRLSPGVVWNCLWY